MMNKETRILRYQARLDNLKKKNPEENAGIIKKLERKIRKSKGE